MKQKKQSRGRSTKQRSRRVKRQSRRRSTKQRSRRVKRQSRRRSTKQRSRGTKKQSRRRSTKQQKRTYNFTPYDLFQAPDSLFEGNEYLNMKHYNQDNIWKNNIFTKIEKYPGSD